MTSITASADAAAAAISLAPSSTGTAASASAALGNTALQQLGSNFNDFLNLLMTQLQNQDPTQPMDTSQFTTELVQFTGVQQQVATNTSLTQLIGLQQTAQTLTASQLVGHQATVTAPEITLQNGHGEIQFTGTAGQQIGIAIVNANGTPIKDATMVAQAGTNTWSWDGTDNAGATVPDGAYRIAVETGSAGSAATSVPFSVIGTATGVSSTGSVTQLQLGQLSVGLSALQSLAGG